MTHLRQRNPPPKAHIQAIRARLSQRARATSGGQHPRRVMPWWDMAQHEGLRSAANGLLDFLFAVWYAETARVGHVLEPGVEAMFPQQNCYSARFSQTLIISGNKPPSSSGLGHHPFKVEITGSNPVGGTRPSAARRIHLTAPTLSPSARTGQAQCACPQ